jgi:hypothetical protein
LGFAAAGSGIRGNQDTRMTAPSGAPAPQAAGESTRIVHVESNRLHRSFLVIGKKPATISRHIRMQTRAFLIDKSRGNLVG